MDLHWLEQTEKDLPEEDTWLSAREISFLNSVRFAKRRADWMLGRWTAKQALAIFWNSPRLPAALAKIEIHAAPSGAPEVFFENKLAPVTISLSHRNNTALCAVAPPSVELGCDLELIESHSDAFIADYFTPEEQALVTGRTTTERSRLLTLLWSAKESALKALHMGLRLDTRCVIVDPVDLLSDCKGWSPLQVRYNGTQIFHGWWQSRDDMVRTLVAAPPPASPIPIGRPK